MVNKKIKDNNLEDSVIYTGWVEIPEFLKKIGYTFSLSSKKIPESFHIAPFECMASNGIGLALKWEGIEYIFPDEAVCNSLDEIVEKIEYYNSHDKDYKEIASKEREFTRENYDLPVIFDCILNLLDYKGEF